MQLVEVTRTAKSRGVIQNKFTFVDLTGSERIKKTEVIDILLMIQKYKYKFIMIRPCYQRIKQI